MLPCPKIVRGQQQLTSEQEAYAREFARERIAAMLSIAPIDEQEAEAHLREAYRVAELEPPATIGWLDSPSFFVGADVARGVKNTMRNDLISAARRSIGISVGGRMRMDVWGSVRPSVMDGVGFSVWVNLCHPRVEMIPGVQAYIDASNLAVYRFWHEVFEENKLIHLSLLSELVSGYWLGDKEAWLVRKPVLLERDEQGRLHCASGPYVQYRDGWSGYAWHGVAVPEKLIIRPEQVTREDWMAARNMEVRRVMQERLGAERFIELLGGTCIDKGKRGSLIEVETVWPDRVAHYVQVQDSSTERQYYLRVPPSITSADEAVAWTFGLDARDYQPGQET